MRTLVSILFLITFTSLSLAQTASVRILLVGDSTVAPVNGWGPGFCEDVSAQVACVNMAKNGRSTKSYRAEGLWKEVMDALGHNAEYQATWVFIQFGHNDQPGKPSPSDPATEFPANLHQFVREVRMAGARPVLITSLTRRTFKDGKLEDTLGPWADATRKVAAEEKVPVLDLNSDSAAAVQKMGSAEADKLAMPEPSFDYTHLGEKGSVFFGRMVADELLRAVPELRPYIKP
jgi:lysophospholipase L1-like esterase